MTRRVLLVFAVVWVLVGGYGVWSYAHDYYVYRGFEPPRDPPGIAQGSLQTIRFRSASLGGERQYDVYLPPGYSAAAARGQRFGVLYLLHGAPGWPGLFMNVGAVGVAFDKLVARHAVGPFLVVMPAGRDGSFRSDTEWANTRHGRWESFVLDVVRSVDAQWPTHADRAHRVLAGLSEGGYAAANIALRHLATFGAFEAWSGYYRQRAKGVFKHASAAQLRANSPLELALTRRMEVARRPLLAYLYGGVTDPDSAAMFPFAKALRAGGANVTVRVLPGRHTWRLWRSQTPAMLRWAWRRLKAGRCTAPCSAGSRSRSRPRSRSTAAISCSTQAHAAGRLTAGSRRPRGALRRPSAMPSCRATSTTTPPRRLTIRATVPRRA